VDQTFVAKTYDRMAAAYDHVFGPIFNPGRRSVIQRMACKPGDRVLEVGVGTGLSLAYYPSSVRVTGIDISAKMLEQAQKRATEDGLRNVDLRIMDAQNLEFEDNSFDKVTAMYVASVVPDPRKMVQEMRRVCKPGGDLFVVNHFSHSNGFIRGFERITSVITPFIGFRSVFPLEEFLQNAGFSNYTLEPVNLFGYWSLIHAIND